MYCIISCGSFLLFILAFIHFWNIRWKRNLIEMIEGLVLVEHQKSIINQFMHCCT